MPNYDSKLAEWFKQLEAKEQELKAKKRNMDREAEHVSRQADDEPAVESIEIESSVLQASSSVLTSVDNANVAADVGRVETPQVEPETKAKEPQKVSDQVEDGFSTPAVAYEEDAAPLFDDEDVPEVEDFLSFLDHPAQPQTVPFEPAQEEVEQQAEESVEEIVAEDTEEGPSNNGRQPYAASSAPEAPQEPISQAEPEVVKPEPEVKASQPPVYRPPHVTPAPRQPIEPVLQFPVTDSSLEKFEEGTGDPLPVSELLARLGVQHQQAAPSEQQSRAETVEAEEVKEVEAVPEPAPEPEPQAQVPQAQTPQVQHAQPMPVEEPVVQRPQAAVANAGALEAAQETVQTNWDRVPHHLQTLFASTGEEVAQNSYKTFKESRAELIQRLLDPVITLEEAARILNVCPTTVRRYTNRGALRHIRTAGNQRRFRLSDVLVFMESGAARSRNND